MFNGRAAGGGLMNRDTGAAGPGSGLPAAEARISTLAASSLDELIP